MAASGLANEIISAIVTPVVLSGAAFGFHNYYRSAVDLYYQNVEQGLIRVVEDEDAQMSERAVREWGRSFTRAYLYRMIQRKSFQLTLVGAFSWILSYISSLATGVLEFVFSSPLGLPAATGLQYLALIAWVIAISFAGVIVWVFGFRPEEEASSVGTEIDS